MKGKGNKKRECVRREENAKMPLQGKIGFLLYLYVELVGENSNALCKVESLNSAEGMHTSACTLRLSIPGLCFNMTPELCCLKNGVERLLTEPRAHASK